MVRWFEGDGDGDDDLLSVFRPRPLCDLPRPHLQMLLYIQRTKPSSSILPMIRMPRMLPLVSSTIQQLVELPTECTMAQSIAGPGQYCTKKIKCHPRSVSYPSRKSSASIRAPARLPSQPRLIQFWDRWSVSGSGSASPIDRRQAIFRAPNGSATSQELSPY